MTLHEADLDRPVPLPSGSCDAVIALDVILHLRDREAVFREVARLLVPEGRFLFTDAGVVTGSISDEQVGRRALHAYTQFVPPGFNERLLVRSGFRLIRTEDRTPGLLKNARGRLAARRSQRAEIEDREGSSDYERQDAYLTTVIELAERGALSRMMYLAQLGVANGPA